MNTIREIFIYRLRRKEVLGGSVHTLLETRITNLTMSLVCDHFLLGTRITNLTMSIICEHYLQIAHDFFNFLIFLIAVFFICLLSLIYLSYLKGKCSSDSSFKK